jgi:hypothetical protein
MTLSAKKKAAGMTIAARAAFVRAKRSMCRRSQPIPSPTLSDPVRSHKRSAPVRGCFRSAAVTSGMAQVAFDGPASSLAAPLRPRT